MKNIGSYIFVVFVTAIIIFGIIRKVRVYECFMEGAKKAVKTAAKKPAQKTLKK